jgi:hypothetical protein
MAFSDLARYDGVSQAQNLQIIAGMLHLPSKVQQVCPKKNLKHFPA